LTPSPACVCSPSSPDGRRGAPAGSDWRRRKHTQGPKH
jgi:hypothetical protein